MPTNAVILANAPIACVLAGNDVAKGSLFGKRIDPLLPQKIYSTYFVIKKIYDNDTNYDGITSACLYLWEIMGKYGIMAQGITGSGSVSPITPSSDYLIPFTGADFTNATDYDNYKFLGKTLEIFWNDANRFLLSSEFSYTATGISILIAGFDATVNPTYQFYAYILNP